MAYISMLNSKKAMITQLPTSHFFLLPDKHKRKEKIPFDDILYLQGNANYTLIHLNNGKIKLSPRTLLYHIQHSLNDSFIRIHRAFCVNRIHVKDTQEGDIKHVTHLFLKDETQLPVSRRKRNALYEL
jgi:DNA-binding LytR/AlgR family response regulator